MSALTVTVAAPGDAALVHRLMLDAFEEQRGVIDPESSAFGESVADVKAAMALGGAVLAWLGTEAVGSCRYEWRDGSVYIGRLAVSPAHRRAGIASAMLAAIEDRARAQGVPEAELAARQVLESNIRLFEGLGYKVTATVAHPRATGPGSYYVEMRKSLA